MFISMCLLIQTLHKKEMYKIAKAILHAQTIREESWTSTVDEKYWGSTKCKYTVEIYAASLAATKKYRLHRIWANIISDMLFSYWNDSQSWAEEVCKAEAVREGAKE